MLISGMFRRADRYGRKRMCLLFTVTYGAACVTKMFNSLPMLAVGRLLAGAATSILFSVFESWLVSSAKSRAFTDGELGELLGRAALCNGLVASASGVFSDGVVAATGSYRTPFVFSGLFLFVAGVLIRANWAENYGGGDASVQSARPPLSDAVAILFKSALFPPVTSPQRNIDHWTRPGPSLLAIGAAMCAFESSSESLAALTTHPARADHFCVHLPLCQCTSLCFAGFPSCRKASFRATLLFRLARCSRASWWR